MIISRDYKQLRLPYSLIASAHESGAGQHYEQALLGIIYDNYSMDLCTRPGMQNLAICIHSPRGDACQFLSYN